MNPQPANHPVMRGGDLNGGQRDETISSKRLASNASLMEASCATLMGWKWSPVVIDQGGDR